MKDFNFILSEKEPVLIRLDHITLFLDTQGLHVLYSSTMEGAYDKLNNENLYRHPFGVNSKPALRAKILCFEIGKR